ncbi:MAG: RluA family pseudouridine synthase [Candidatus Shapirobacteria bacterium]|nr:RluA family pseudouridine synthase [Candidatus Shapirobacteria bacterium]MDD3002282.1 RluA family pseudouridine synthase [Candidatus Shapirobacteria bacterium]MDD4382713.1 RluA family pseudouridine synthase [Candidatus Shapirobacteria bacterium]
MEKVKIIFEDKDMMVMEKPSLMTTTKEKKEEKGTLEDYLRDIRPNDLPRNGIIHRLDKGTSGLILVAKTEEAFLGLKKQFKERSLTKKYYCLVGGDVSFEGVVDMPIARSKYAFAKFGVNEEGKRALTKFKLIKKYKNNGKIYSLLDIDLSTGRTHQIRVHLSHLRWPLVGDRVYGGEIVDGLKRPFLHAYKIVFKHPINNQEMKVEIDLSEDLVEILKKYEEC